MESVSTIHDALAEGRHAIEGIGSDEAALEAELLMRHALGVDRAHLYERLQDPLDAVRLAEYRALLERRLAHEPTAYIIGDREFFGLDFEVSPAALIPRPETETLVEMVIAYARERAGPLNIADVGVGAGTIAVALAHELADVRIVATDTSQGALDLARRNAERHGIANRIDFRLGDLLAPIEAPVDVIAANLPYVTTELWEAMPPEIREHEPRAALDGGADGLDVVRRLLADAPAHMAPGGALFCEIGDWQGEAVRNLAANAFPDARVEVHLDLAGRDRVLALYC
jgi:release factor glutamine methyltransferase